MTVQCDPDDNIGRRIRSSDEKRQNCGFELVAIEIVNWSVGECFGAQNSYVAFFIMTEITCYESD